MLSDLVWEATLGRQNHSIRGNPEFGFSFSLTKLRAPPLSKPFPSDGQRQRGEMTLGGLIPRALVPRLPSPKASFIPALGNAQGQRPGSWAQKSPLQDEKPLDREIEPKLLCIGLTSL